MLVDTQRLRILKTRVKERSYGHITNWEKDGIIRIFTGELNPEEILTSNFDIYNQPNFETVNYIINDFTGVTGLTLDNEHTKIYASTDDIISRTKGKLLIAIVATQQKHIALAKSYQQEMKNNLFVSEIFESIEDAKIWVES